MPTMGPADGSVIIDIDGDQKPLDDALEKSEKDLEKFGKKSNEIFKKSAKIAAAGFVAMSVASIKFGSDLEQSLANASTLFGDTEVDMDNLKEKMLDVSDATGVTAKSLSDGLYQALSAGVPITEDAAEAMLFMEKSAKLAKAGFTDVTSAIDATTSVLNAYGLKLEETDRVQGILIQTQNKGKTTLDELSKVMGNINPIAASLGFSFEQVGAAMASITAKGVPTSQAATQLRSLLSEISKEGTKASKALAETYQNTEFAGESFEVLTRKGVSVDQILNDMSRTADKNGISLKDMFGSVEAGNAALLLSGENSKTYSDNLQAMGDVAGVVDDAFQKVDETVQSKLNKTLNKLTNIAIKFFDILEPVVNGLLDMVNHILDFDTVGQIMVVVLGTIVALVTAYHIQQAVASVQAAIWAVTSGTATAATTALGAAFQFLLGPIGLAIIAIGAVIAIGVLLASNWETISRDMNRLGNAIAQGFSNSMNWIVDSVTGLIDFLTGTFINVWESVWTGALSIFQGIWNGLVEFFKLPFNAVIEGINMFIKALNLIKIPEWVPGFGGAGFNIPEIPKLAKGGVAFGETLAMVGDNPDAAINPEVVAPVNVLKSMITDIGVNQKQMQPIKLDAILQLDGSTIARSVIEYEDEERSYF